MKVNNSSHIKFITSCLVHWCIEDMCNACNNVELKVQVSSPLNC